MLKLNSFLHSSLIKGASLAITAYSMVFLLVLGGAESVGFLATVTAFTAPIFMFSNFRHVEHISLSSEVRESTALSYRVSAILAIFFLVVFAVFAFLFEFTPGGHAFFLMILVSKIFEQFLDFSAVYLIKTGSRDLAARSAFVRMFVLFFFTVTFFFLDLNLLINTSLSLLLAYVSSVLVEIRALDYLRLKKSAGEMLSYSINNYKYALLNVFISVNSMIPRYMLIAFSDASTVGRFSLLYQIAATLVNLFQYAVSVNSNAVLKIVESKKKLFGIGALGLLLFSLLLYVCYFFYHAQISVSVWYFLSVLLMFLALFLRGVLLVALIARSVANIFGMVFFSSLVSFFLVIGFFIFEINAVELMSAILFVVFSSMMTFLIGLKRIGL